MLTFNMIISPFVSLIIFEQVFKNNEKVSEEDLTYGILPTIIYSNVLPLYLRYAVQIILLCILNQIMLNLDKIAECFEKTTKYQRKTSFESHFYDLSYKQSIIIVLFAFGIFFCLISSQITFVILCFFCLQFYIDKYNLMYIYPLEFESQYLNR